LEDLYYFFLFLPSSSLLLNKIKNHDNVKDYVSLVFEGFNTHEIHNVELIHQVQELFLHFHIHFRSRVRVESVLQGIRDKEPENVKGHVDLVNLVVGRVEGKLLKRFLIGPETLHNRGEIIQEVLLAI
jgi:hypothetical protein